ncbi:hypothetical protein [Corynebacterium camporealensis]|uniref:hypothetical protein n=1 Tax=Corynebacterium camporealensis TaxID=161896 RepID=UPI00052E2F74|nr:hypothetical protein [Corynebacterium camporealensis]
MGNDARGEKNAMVHFSIVENRTNDCWDYNSTSVLFSPFATFGAPPVWDSGRAIPYVGNVPIEI